MSKYIYQSPKECSRALKLIMEQMDKETETYNALETAINYLFVMQLECDDDKKKRDEETKRWERAVAEKNYKKEPIIVGDEIIVYDEGVENCKFRATVTDIDCDGALWILDEAGANTVINPDDDRKREKTGRHFSYVDDLIYSMGRGLVRQSDT